MNRMLRVSIFCIGLSVMMIGCKEKPKEQLPPTQELPPPPKPTYEYGFNLLDYNVVKDTLRSGDTFGELLNNQHISPKKVAALAELAKEYLRPKDFRAGQPYAFIFEKIQIRLRISSISRTCYIS